jgi:hypothetical protein
MLHVTELLQEGPIIQGNKKFHFAMKPTRSSNASEVTGSTPAFTMEHSPS